MKKNGHNDEDLADSTKKSFFDRLEAVCRIRGVSVTSVLKALDLAMGSTTTWKKSAPVGDTVVLLARHLGVTTDSLLTDDAPILTAKSLPISGTERTVYTPQEQELLEGFRPLPASQKHAILSIINRITEEDNTLEVSMKKQKGGISTEVNHNYI